MRAEELMVGDWVMWKNRKVQIARVGGIVYSFGHIDVTLAHCNDDKILETHDIKSISPIPLTSEILEKNGFGYVEIDPLMHLTHYYPGEPRFCHDMDTHIGTDWKSFWLNCDRNSIYGIQYVHQLQHALRLCGKNQEIIL